MKQQNNLKTPTQMDRFNRALSGLSQVETPFQDESQSSLAPSVQTKTEPSKLDGVRAPIVAEVMARHSGLTEAEVLEGMEAMGF
jgi:hypothetical protein